MEDDVRGPRERGGLQDASISSKAEDTASAMGKAAEASDKATDATIKITEAIAKATETIQKFADVLEHSTKDSTKTKTATEQMIHAVSVASAALNAMSDISAVMATTTGEGVTKILSRTTSSIAGLIAATQPEFIAVAVAVSAAGRAFDMVTQAIDASITAQRGAAEALLMMGAAAKDATLGKGTLSQGPLIAGTHWGLQPEQAAALSKSFAEAGLASGKLSSGMSAGEASMKALAHASDLVGMLHWAEGMEIKSSTELIAKMGGHFQLSGAALDDAASRFVTGAHKNRVSIELFGKETESVADAFRGLGGTMTDAIGVTTVWYKELQKGTTSAQQLATAYSTSAGGIEGMVSKARLLLNYAPEIATKMGLREGMSVQEQYNIMASTGGQKTFRGEGGDPALANAMASRLGMNNAMGFRQIMTGPLGANLGEAPEAWETARASPKAFAGKNEDIATKESAERAAAEEVKKNLATAAEKLAPAALTLSTIVLDLNKKFGLNEGIVNIFKLAVDKFDSAARYSATGELWDDIKSIAKFPFEGKEAIAAGSKLGTEGNRSLGYITKPIQVNFGATNIHLAPNMENEVEKAREELREELREQNEQRDEQIVAAWNAAQPH